MTCRVHAAESTVRRTKFQWTAYNIDWSALHASLPAGNLYSFVPRPGRPAANAGMCEEACPGLTALKTGGELAAFVSARLASGLLGLAGAGLFRLLISCCMEGQGSQQQSPRATVR